MRPRRAARGPVVDVATTQPSPFARSLLFGYVAQFVYEGDSPIAERRAAALSLDQGLLAELLGRAELRELLDPEVLAEVEAELQRLAPDRRARDAEGVADLLRLLGPLTHRRGRRALRRRRRRRRAGWPRSPTPAASVQVRMAGEERWAAIEDVGRLRDGLGVAGAARHARRLHRAVDDPLGDLVGRYARTHGPFTAAEVAARLGLGAAVARQTLQRLGAPGPRARGRVPARPAPGSEWCDAEVLRELRRRSLARLRQEVEPVEPEALGRFLPAWQHVAPAGGAAACAASTACSPRSTSSPAAPVPASALESLVLPPGSRDYQPALLDELTATGEVLWAGHGRCPAPTAGSASTSPTRPHADRCPSRARRARAELPPGGARRPRRRAARGSSGSSPTRSAPPSDRPALAAALWELVWAGRVSNDTLAPLRALTGPAARRPPHPPHAASRPAGRPGRRPRCRLRSRPARDRRPLGAAARPSTPTRPGARTPPPSGCSSGTAW